MGNCNGRCAGHCNAYHPPEHFLPAPNRRMTDEERDLLVEMSFLPFQSVAFRRTIQRYWETFLKNGGEEDPEKFLIWLMKV